jgi:maleate isomerase
MHGEEYQRVVAEFDTPDTGTAIGVIAPFDFLLDRELWSWDPSDTTLHITRTPYMSGEIGLRLVRQLGDDRAITAAAASLRSVHPQVTVSLCTSSRSVDGPAGERKLRAAMRRGGARQAITTSGALVEALHAVKAGRVAVATPYDAPLTARLAGFLVEAGFVVSRSVHLDLTGNVAAVSGRSVAALARAAAEDGADAVFLACTNLRTADLLGDIEHELGVPVLSANQVTMWAALQRIGAGRPDRSERLFHVAGA